MTSKRSLKVAELLRHEIAKVLREDIGNTKLHMVTITKILVSPDLKLAKIHITILGPLHERDETMTALEKAKSFIRQAAGSRLGLKYVPELVFYYDETLDYAESIERLLNKIR